MRKFRVRKCDYGWKVQVKEERAWFWHTISYHDHLEQAMTNYEKLNTRYTV